MLKVARQAKAVIRLEFHTRASAWLRFLSIPCIDGRVRVQSPTCDLVGESCTLSGPGRAIPQGGGWRVKKTCPPQKAMKSDWKALEIVHPDAAGIDIGSHEHWVAISPDKDEQPVRSFECFTADVGKRPVNTCSQPARR